MSEPGLPSLLPPAPRPLPSENFQPIRVAPRHSVNHAPHAVHLPFYKELSLRIVAPSRDTANCVLLKERTFGSLFRRETDEPLVRIGHRIYRAVINNLQGSDTFGVSQQTAAQLSSNCISSHNQLVAAVSAVRGRPGPDAAHISVTIALPQQLRSGDAAQLDFDGTLGAVITTVKNQWLIKGQTLLVPILGTYAELTVTMTQAVNGIPIPVHVKVTNSTLLTLVAGEGVHFVSRIVQDALQHVDVKIGIKVKNGSSSWQKVDTLLPVSIGEEVLRKTALDHLADREFRVGYTGWTQRNPRQNYHIEVTHATIPNQLQSHLTQEPLYRTGPQTALNIHSDGSIIVIPTDTLPVPAGRLVFTITEEDPLPTNCRAYHAYIAVDSLVAAIRAQSETQSFVRDMHLRVQLPTGKFLLRIGKGSPADPATNLDSKTGVVPWVVTDATKLDFKIDRSISCKLVDTAEPLPLTELKFAVATPISDKDKKKPAPKSELITNDELVQLVRDATPQVLRKDECLHNSSSSGRAMVFTVEDWTSSVPEVEEPQYGRLGQINAETKFTFSIAQDASVSVTNHGIPINPLKLAECLARLGLGGLQPQLEVLFRKIVMSSGAFSEIDRQAGIKPEKGVLLYGPPGTGKTLISKKIAELVGVHEDNVNIVSVGDLLSKWVGETDQNIRKLFEKAKQDYKRHGKNAAKHVIVLDEFESIMADRESAQRRHEATPVATLLAEMDGKPSTPNVIVFGLTNYKDKIDQALLRSGRFGIQLELKLPDEPARVEIFEIFLKSKRELGMLAPEVTPDKLASLTEGYSGAAIESIVNTALTFPKQRVFDARAAEIEAQRGDATDDTVAKRIHAPLTLDEFIGHPQGKVTLDDLRKAIKEVNKSEEPMDMSLRMFYGR